MTFALKATCFSFLKLAISLHPSTGLQLLHVEESEHRIQICLINLKRLRASERLVGRLQLLGQDDILQLPKEIQTWHTDLDHRELSVGGVTEQEASLDLLKRHELSHVRNKSFQAPTEIGPDTLG